MFGLVFSPLRVNVLELSVPIRVGGSFLLFDVGVQAVIIFFQHPADHRQADPVGLGFQSALDVPQPAIEPLPVTHRILGGIRLDDGQQGRD
jgi:hypothetical protein